MKIEYILGLLDGFVIGGFIGLCLIFFVSEINSKTKLSPILEIKCINNTCDTSYVYRTKD